MKKYQHQYIEGKWQEKWKEDQLYEVDLNNSKDHYYVLAEFTYPSGDLHMGHWFTFILGDIYARFKRMQGLRVFFPNGFDAFGLPAENAAIKRGIHPSDWTYANIKRMKEQFATMGAAFDWSHEVITCDPDYYKLNQWIFLKMYEKGLAYRGKAMSNWCPICQTVLANENVEAGHCWRCQTEVIQKEVEQWFLKITAYADKLIWPDSSAGSGPAVDWPKSLRDAQNSWIGKSKGLVIRFDGIEVFTTRPDTLFGAAFVVISPEHPLLNRYVTVEQKKAADSYLEATRKKSELQRRESKVKTGIFTGSYVENPLTKEEIPVWVADYVLPGYGTGAIMGVPAHDVRDFEFAQKQGLPVKRVIKKTEDETGIPYEGEGVLINSNNYDGLSSEEARQKISKYIVQHKLGVEYTSYHLHDWSISRQRYWGTPIPIIYCDKCGVVPVLEEDLPVVLPYQVDYAPKGKPPLATAEDWVKVNCPKCGGEGRREVETMDTFVDSSWYFFRFLDPKNQKEIFNKALAASWMPLDIYIGGAEHTLGHALYSRFFTKFFHDIGLVKFDEYAKRRVHHGLILGPDGQKMSKSRGNVINPDEQVRSYGADAVRTYLAFLGPYDIVAPWNPAGVNGTFHFIERVWGLFDKVDLTDGQKLTFSDLRVMNTTIKKAQRDAELLKFNTTVAALMEWLNYLSRKSVISRTEYKNFLLLLAPFAPHITEELWEMMGEEYSVHQQSWPKVDSRYLEEELATIVVQVNGRVRDQIRIEMAAAGNKEAIEKLALESEKVRKFIDGKEIQRSIYVPGKVLNLVISN